MQVEDQGRQRYL